VRLIAALAVLGAAAGDAAAYPELQLSRGTTCTQCHGLPSGEVVLGQEGRWGWSELATWDGDGRLFHGPHLDGFPIGGALTLAAGVHGTEVATDGYGTVERIEIAAHGTSTKGLGLGWTFGNYGAAGPDLRTFYVHHETRGGEYLRAGKVPLVYGLRPADQTAYVRRRLGMGRFEEPWGIGFGGIYRRWEVHVAGFGGGPTGDIGLAVYWERRRDTLAWALQARVTGSDNDQQTWIGGVYKRWLPAPMLMVLAELDLGVQEFRDGTERLDIPPAVQMVGHAGVHRVGRRGVTVGATIQAHDPDLALEGTSRAGAGAELRWTPRPHYELHIHGKIEAAGLDLDHPDVIAQLRLQYFL
jgi:hypothetical protein